VKLFSKKIFDRASPKKEEVRAKQTLIYDNSLTM
jgi:hypothetical protein